MTLHSSRAADLSQRAFERILIVKPSSLGDIIHTLPVLHRLRCRYPEARIDWLVAPAFAPLIAEHPDLTEAVLFDRRLYGRIGRSGRASAALLALLRALRRRRYDLVIDLQGLFRSGFLARATGAPVRLGFAAAREFAILFYTHRVRVDDADAHAVDRNLKLVAPLGIEDGPARFDLALSAEELNQADAMLAAAGADAAQSLVGVIPGARWETKRWPPERFAATVDALADQPHVQYVLMGSPDERELCNHVARLGRRPVVNLAGETTLRQMAAVIARLSVVLCHDSAAMHLAVALERPLVCITGPTNPARTGPYGRPQDVLRLPLDCSPCYLRRLDQCPYQHRCMRDLAVEVVVGRVKQAMGPAIWRFGDLAIW